MSHGMNHMTCLDRMCDPKIADFNQADDIYDCARYLNVTLKCLANNIDYTQCCVNRGLPSDCLPICSGKVIAMDFNYIK